MTQKNLATHSLWISRICRLMDSAREYSRSHPVVTIRTEMQREEGAVCSEINQLARGSLLSGGLSTLPNSVVVNIWKIQPGIIHQLNNNPLAQVKKNLLCQNHFDDNVHFKLHENFSIKIFEVSEFEYNLSCTNLYGRNSNCKNRNPSYGLWSRLNRIWYSENSK